MTTTRVRNGHRPGDVLVEIELQGTRYWALTELADARGIPLAELIAEAALQMTENADIKVTPIGRGRVGRPRGNRSAAHERIRMMIDEGMKTGVIAAREQVSASAVSHLRRRFSAEAEAAATALDQAS